MPDVADPCHSHVLMEVLRVLDHLFFGRIQMLEAVSNSCGKLRVVLEEGRTGIHDGMEQWQLQEECANLESFAR